MKRRDLLKAALILPTIVVTTAETPVDDHLLSLAGWSCEQFNQFMTLHYRDSVTFLLGGLPQFTASSVEITGSMPHMRYSNLPGTECYFVPVGKPKYSAVLTNVVGSGLSRLNPPNCKPTPSRFTAALSNSDASMVFSGKDAIITYMNDSKEFGAAALVLTMSEVDFDIKPKP